MSALKKNAFPLSLSLILSAGVFSGIDGIQSTSALIMGALSCLVIAMIPIAASTVGFGSFAKDQPPLWLGVLTTSIQWASLVYAGFYIVLALSFTSVILITYIRHTVKP